MKHIKLRFLFTLLIITGFTPRLSAQNLGVHPTILEYKLPAGQSESQVIHLSNGSAVKKQYRIYLNDWLRDSTGGHAYYRPDTLPQSISKWISIDKNFVEMEPGQSADLTVKLSLPDEAAFNEAMKWSMLFIETVEEQASDAVKGAQVRNHLRIGIHIYQTPPALNEKSVKVFDLSPVPDTKNEYRLLCQNTGKVMLECRSYLELASLADGTKTKIEVNEFPLFPGQPRYVNFELPNDLPKGKYSALGVLDAGEDVSLEAVESVIEIK
jgi:hypothetical protein